MDDRLTELREKYGKRDGSTYYPPDEVYMFPTPKVLPFVRIRRFWHCLTGAVFVLTHRNAITGRACACPGTCMTLGFCPLVGWRWVDRFVGWRQHNG